MLGSETFQVGQTGPSQGSLGLGAGPRAWKGLGAASGVQRWQGVGQGTV